MRNGRPVTEAVRLNGQTLGDPIKEEISYSMKYEQKGSIWGGFKDGMGRQL